MADEVITTGVDDLLEYLGGKDKVALQDVAKVLGIPHETLQAWVDFLVEEKILGIEYKFTKPYVYLNREGGQKKKGEQLGLNDLREEYERHAREKKMPGEKIAELWRTHVADALDRKKEYFLEEAKVRGLPNTDEHWEAYRKNVLARC